MEIQEAFKYLNLDIDSSKEEIDKRFKELSLNLHPDKGGSDNQMFELNNARELAIEYSSNKSLVKVVREIARADSKAIQRSIEIDKEVNSVYKRAKRRIGNKLKSFKDITGLLGLVSAVSTLAASKVLPILELPENSITPKVALMVTVILGIYYLLFSNRVKKMEENVADFKDSLDDKEDIYYLLQEIFRPRLGEWINKNDLNELLSEWSERKSEERTEPVSIFLLSSSTSPKRMCRLVGNKDFLKMILLKGEQNKFIETQEYLGEFGLEVKYKVLKKTSA